MSIAAGRRQEGYLEGIEEILPTQRHLLRHHTVERLPAYRLQSKLATCAVFRGLRVPVGRVRVAAEHLKYCQRLCEERPAGPGRDFLSETLREAPLHHHELPYIKEKDSDDEITTRARKQ